jgi:predicted CopG family antitoxin
MKVRRTVTIDEEINQKLDEMRAGRTQFFSNFINDALREKLKLKK